MRAALRLGMALVVLAALFVPSRAQERPPADVAWTRVHAAAEKGVEQARTALEGGRFELEDVEAYARWSARVVEAGLRAGQPPAELHAAHTARLQRLVTDTRRRRDVGAASELHLTIAEYHQAHAEAWAAGAR